MEKFSAFTLAACVSFVSSPVFAGPITLQDALDMAIASNSQIKSERAKVDMAESEQSEALSRFFPQLSLSASVTKINDPITIDLSSLQAPLADIAGASAYSKAYLTAYNVAYQKAYATAFEQTYQQAYNLAYESAVAQMVAAGLPQEMAEQRAKAAVDAKTDDIRSAVSAKSDDIWSAVVNKKTVNDIAVQAAEETGTQYGSDASKAISESKDFKMKVQDDLFFNARLTAIWPIFTGFKRTAAYDAAKSNVTAKKAAFNMAQNTILMDVATKYFTLRLAEELTTMRETTVKNLEEHLERSKKLEAGGQISKAERLRAEVALAEAVDALEDSHRDQSMARLALASLLHTDTNLTAVTPVMAPEQTLSMEEFKTLAIERHPGLWQLRTERKRSQNAVKAAQGDYYPMIALFAYKELYTRDLTILEPEWAVGAKLQWDLFKGGETRAKVSSAKALDRSLASMEESTIDNIKLLVEKRWREKEHALSRLTSLKKTRELAEEAHRSQILAYEAGLGTSLDVVDAELALSRLQVADLKGHYDAVIAWLGLLEASGEVVNAGTMLTAVQPVEEKANETPVSAPVETPVLLPAVQNAVVPADSAAAPVEAAPATDAEAPAAVPAEQPAVETAPVAP
ncbi:MAG: TolC family protein [Fibrobacter sp.]|nr:TolC family protein [Fibrobacter sp.]